MQIDDSVISEELLRRGAGPRLQRTPGGVGTLYLADRFLQAGFRTVRVFGKKSRGVDLRCEADRAVVYVECKDRDLHAAFCDSDERLEAWIRNRVSEAIRKLKPSEPASRVVALTGVLPLRKARRLQARFADVVARLLKAGEREDLPKGVCAVFLGIGFDGSSIELKGLGSFVEIENIASPGWTKLRERMRRAFPDTPA